MKRTDLTQMSISDDSAQSPAAVYTNQLSRRDSLKLLAALAASAMLPALAGCEPTKTPTSKVSGNSSSEHWPELRLPAIDAKGYGKDPNLIMPPESPWPLTLSADQLTLLAVISDILVPKEGSSPSASQVQVPSVIDEWVSAPYPNQQRDRLTILSALAWIDDEAEIRFARQFNALTAPERLAIVDDIAYDNDKTPAQFQRIANAFSRLRNLVLAAYFCTPEGIKDIGYLGNVPVAGAYPGPTPEAYSHLDKTLAQLGLTDFAYPVA